MKTFKLLPIDEEGCNEVSQPKYNTVEKVVNVIGKRVSKATLDKFIEDNYFDITGNEDDKIADLYSFYKIDG